MLLSLQTAYVSVFESRELVLVDDEIDSAKTEIDFIAYEINYIGYDSDTVDSEIDIVISEKEADFYEIYSIYIEIDIDA